MVRTSVNLSPHLPTFSKVGRNTHMLGSPPGSFIGLCSYMVLQVDVGYRLLLVLKTVTT